MGDADPGGGQAVGGERGCVEDDIAADRRTHLRQFFAGVVLYSQAVADRLGIGASDLHCLNILALSGPLSAGQLGQLTGLTSGAVTRLVDRLEAAGFVERARDSGDRRRVIVKRVGTGEVAPLMAPLGRRMAQTLQAMSEDQRHAVDLFLAQCLPLFREETARLRSSPPPP